MLKNKSFRTIPLLFCLFSYVCISFLHTQGQVKSIFNTGQGQVKFIFYNYIDKGQVKSIFYTDQGQVKFINHRDQCQAKSIFYSG